MNDNMSRQRMMNVPIISFLFYRQQQITTLNLARDCTKVQSTRMHLRALVLHKYLPPTATAVTTVRFASPGSGAFLPKGIITRTYSFVLFTLCR